MQEIERKWFVGVLPKDLASYPNKALVAGYFEDEDGKDIRIRQEGDKYFKVKKSGHGIARDIGPVGDEEITKEVFYSLWPKTEGRRLWKTRYYIPYGQYIIELDIYRDFPGLYTAEVEFKTVKEARKFVPPDWFGEDITGVKKFSSNSLATRGLTIIDQRFFDLKSGIQASLRLARVLSRVPIIILVAGGSASGKTSAVAQKMKDEFGDKASILSMDDYYRGTKFMKAEAAKGNVLNWDQPEAFDIDLLLSHLQTLKRGYTIEKPKYNFKTGEVKGSEQFSPVPVIILEGLFALNDTLAGLGDVKIFVDIGFHGRILRRLFRDVERTGQRPIDILRQCIETVEPMYEKYIQGTKANADLIILNEYDPDIEAKKCSVNESQLKFRTQLTGEELKKMGAQGAGAIVQKDHYYNPKDRDLRSTGEILRVREEAGLTLLTYKGPKVDSLFRERPLLEFEIDLETKERFLNLYGNKVRTIVKTREIYQLNGIVFSLDNDVSIIDDASERNLGKFIEIRSGEEDSINKVIGKLGLTFDRGIRESYFEM